jgi:hypothetical protein
MFCDLVSSMALASRLDPEDLLHRGSGGGMYTRKAHATRETPMRDQG